MAQPLGSDGETQGRDSSPLPAAVESRYALAILRCPRCRSTGRMTGLAWACDGCGSTYPIRGGVLDFRNGPVAANLSFAHAGGAKPENERVAGLLRQQDKGSYSDLVHIYFGQYQSHAEVVARERASLLEAVRHAEEWLFQFKQVVPLNRVAERGAISIDIGCGTGGLVAVLARFLPFVLGVDADLERLVLARKLCQELRVQNSLFVCGHAEALPLADECSGLVTAIEVFEHSADQQELLREVHRVLAPTGYLYLTTPNRFTLMPEPHVDLWGVGFLPRRLADRYVQFRLGVPYRNKRNPSRHELSRMLRRAFQGNYRFVREHRLRYSPQARIANALLAWPVIDWAVKFVVSGFHVVAWRAPKPPTGQKAAG